MSRLTSSSSPVTFFMSSEHSPHSEELLSLLSSSSPAPLSIGTTFDPFPISFRQDSTSSLKPGSPSSPPSLVPRLRLSSSSVSTALQSSLDRLGLGYIYLYTLDASQAGSMIFPTRTSAAKGIINCQNRGTVQHIGVRDQGKGKAQFWSDKFHKLGGKIDVYEVSTGEDRQDNDPTANGMGWGWGGDVSVLRRDLTVSPPLPPDPLFLN